MQLFCDGVLQNPIFGDVAGFRVGQSVPVAGRNGVQVPGDARGVFGGLRGAQSGRAVGRVRPDRERHGVRGHAAQQPVAGRGARGRAGRAGGHVLRAGRPQRRVRAVAGAVGARARARAPRRQRAHGTRDAGGRAAGRRRRAARGRARQLQAVVLVDGAGEEAEVSGHMTTGMVRASHHLPPRSPSSTARRGRGRRRDVTTRLLCVMPSCIVITALRCLRVACYVL